MDMVIYFSYKKYKNLFIWILRCYFKYFVNCRFKIINIFLEKYVYKIVDFLVEFWRGFLIC